MKTTTFKPISTQTLSEFAPGSELTKALLALDLSSPSPNGRVDFSEFAQLTPEHQQAYRTVQTAKQQQQRGSLAKAVRVVLGLATTGGIVAGMLTGDPMIMTGAIFGGAAILGGIGVSIDNTPGNGGDTYNPSTGTSD